MGYLDNMENGPVPEKSTNQEEIEAIIMKSYQGRGSLSKDDFLKLFEANQLNSLRNVKGACRSLEDFTGLDNEVAFKLLEAGETELLVYNLDKFVNVDHEKLAFKIVEMGSGAFLLRFLERFPGIDYNKLALKLVEADSAETLLNNLKALPLKDHDEIINEMIEETIQKRGIGYKNKSAVYRICDHLDELKGLSRETGKKLMALMADGYGGLDRLGALNNYYSPPLDRIISRTPEIFGEEAGLYYYRLLRKIADNDPQTVSELDLKNGGEDGLREIQEKSRGFKIEMIKEDFNPEVLVSNEKNKFPLELLFKKAVRYEESEWGERDEDSFANTIEDYLEYKKSDGAKPLNKEFTPSEYLDVKKVDTEAREKYVFNCFPDNRPLADYR